VEIKQRLNRVTQKRRVLLPYGVALRLCSERRPVEAEAFAQTSQDIAVIEEIVSMLWQYNLGPASLIRYTRQAWIGADYDIGLRVTFDTNMSYRASELRLEELQSGLALFTPDLVIIEIKVNERIPYWLTELVAVHNLNLVRMSKYCRSIELAQNLPVLAGRFTLV
jgi:hypothetical protein